MLTVVSRNPEVTVPFTGYFKLKYQVNFVVFSIKKNNHNFCRLFYTVELSNVPLAFVFTLIKMKRFSGTKQGTCVIETLE